MAEGEAATKSDIQNAIQISKLEDENKTLKTDLETATAHRRLGQIITHAREACPTCQQDLETHNQGVIKAALEGLDQAAVRELAVKKGVFPKTLTVQVP